MLRPDPLGELTALPKPIAGFRGLFLRGEGKGREENREGDRGGVGREGLKEGRGRGRGAEGE